MTTYNIVKINCMTEEEQNMGSGYTMEDVKAITKGYKFNGLFYTRTNSKWMFIVEEDQEGGNAHDIERVFRRL